MITTASDYEAQAAEYGRQAGREYARARADARRAAHFYQTAASRRRHAAWLTRRPELWDATRATDPARWEDDAATFAGIADLFLAKSFSSTGNARFYRGLMHDYERMAAGKRADYAAAEAAEQAEVTTPCAICAAHASVKPGLFWARRGPDWPLTEVAGHTVHKACAYDAERRVADVATGQLVIGADGIGRWSTNSHAIPDDCAAEFAALELAPALDLAATRAANDAEAAQAIAAYRAAQPAEPSAEQRADMLAAFGPGATVVDVITGRTTQL
jgi:hypothetical protein